MATKFDEKRNEILEVIRAALHAHDYDTLTTGSNEICVPLVTDDGDEGYCVLTAKIPKGSRDGDIYDGYEVAQDYARHIEEMAQKKAEAQKKKAEKIARDEERRRKAAEAKEKRDAASTH